MSYPFTPRDWQERFVRELQTNIQKNTLVEACTSAGKTPFAIYCYVFLKDGLDWSFLLSVVPSEHLKRQYAQDAKKLFGLNLYYSGTSTRIGRLPTPQELEADGYQGLVLSYQWLTKSDNAETLRQELERSMRGKVFLILDEVHHASSELAFGQACETAFPDHVVSHRLMTSGTPFRSDQNRILGNWLNYASVEENVYECLPDFRYTLADALREEVIPAFSFVTLAGEFTYRRGQFEYRGKTFTDAQNEQELTDAINTAIYVEGGWVQNAIEWAYGRMKRDRAKGLPECATYVRVPTIKAARKMKERILRLTGERALVVVSKDDEDKEPVYSRKLNEFVKDLLGIKNRSKSIRMDNPKKAAQKLLEFYQGERLKELVEYLNKGLKQKADVTNKDNQEILTIEKTISNGRVEKQSARTSDQRSSFGKHGSKETNIPVSSSILEEDTKLVESSDNTQEQSETISEKNPEEKAIKPNENISDSSFTMVASSNGIFDQRLTKDELAERLGVHPTTFSDVFYKRKEKFTQWTQKKDPDNIGWTRTQEKQGRNFLFAPIQKTEEVTT